MNSSSDNSNKPWGGRFLFATDDQVEAFTASVDFDRRLYPYDIRGSIAHARMLAKIGVLTGAECAQIVAGLEDIEGDIARGEFAWSMALEDVHMNIEARLVDRIGEVGKKLHTARSRNDQVATDLRLYLRDEVDTIRAMLAALMQRLIEFADREVDTIMPGFTHLQIAQPVTLGHHVLAWFEMLYRDAQRLADCRRRINVSPLGAAALAGAAYPLDRRYTAALLGFDGICENSIDAVSDRDFAIEFLACAAILMMHLSRWSEELILWQSQPFACIDIGEAYCTGSSIMPQKKNPDVPELVRGKCGRVYGALLALLTLMKGQPLAYNRDNQEDKAPLFDAVDTVKSCVRIYTGLIPAITVRRERLRELARQGYATATDLADYLVGKDLPFREAHGSAGRAVAHALAAGKDLAELSLEELRTFSDRIGSDVYDWLSLEGSVARRKHAGATAPAEVRAALERARTRLEQLMMDTKGETA